MKSSSLGDIISLKSGTTDSAKYRKMFIDVEDELKSRGLSLYDEIENNGLAKKITPMDICREVAKRLGLGNDNKSVRRVYDLTRTYWQRRKVEICGA